LGIIELPPFVEVWQLYDTAATALNTFSAV